MSKTSLDASVQACTKMKKPISATIDVELINWIEKELQDRQKYRNKSHLIEIALHSLKNNKGKITIGGMTAAGALIVILLTIYEKAEAIIAKAQPAPTENIIPGYMATDKSDYFIKQSIKR